MEDAIETIIRYLGPLGIRDMEPHVSPHMGNSPWNVLRYAGFHLWSPQDDAELGLMQDTMCHHPLLQHSKATSSMRSICAFLSGDGNGDTE